MQIKPHQRQRFYELHLQGLTYPEIAEQFGISKECVRYWYRRQHAGQGPHTVCRGRSPGLLSGFDPKVPYCTLRLRLEHPH